MDAPPLSPPRPDAEQWSNLMADIQKKPTLWGKISNTLGRKKRRSIIQATEKDLQVLYEDCDTVDAPDSTQILPVIEPPLPPPIEELIFCPKTERATIDNDSLRQSDVRELQEILISWLNVELAEKRILIQDLDEDLFDGQVLHKLWEKLANRQLPLLEVTHSKQAQREKLATVLNEVNETLGLDHSHTKWTAKQIHTKNLVAIFHLLIALARHFEAPIRLPENVTVTVVVTRKHDESYTRKYQEELTSDEILFDCDPKKLEAIHAFVNHHLKKLKIHVYDLHIDFRDGVNLLLLTGLLGGFYVPLHCYQRSPKNNDQMVKNVAFAFELMQDVGLAKPRVRPEDVVNMDLRSTMQILNNLMFIGLC